MTANRLFRELVPLVLAAALFCSCVVPAGAAETAPAETVPVTEPAAPDETAPVTEATAPDETAPVTEATAPDETVPVTEPTAPAETAPVTEPTVPDETVPVTGPAIPDETIPVTEPTLPEETAPPTEPAGEPAQVMSIASCLAQPGGTEGITIRGTVVYAAGAQAVLQDDTGGIRLSFSADPGTFPGEILQVTGRRTGGLAVESFESHGTGPLPAEDGALENVPENLRVKLSGAELKNGQLHQNGLSLTLAANLPGSAAQSGRVDAWGVILDGVFYADMVSPAPEEGLEAEELPWKHFFGLLHAHSDLSDGDGTVEELFQVAANAEDLDFFAITDHGDSLDNANSGTIDSEKTDFSREWTRGKAAARAVSGGDFLGIYAYEMSWPEEKEIGHISTFFTPGWQAWTHPDYNEDVEKEETLNHYFSALTKVEQAVSQFNHPDPGMGDLNRFSDYDPAWDKQLHLLELGSGEIGREYYDMALKKGWHLAPTVSLYRYKDLWNGEGGVRTVVLAEELTEKGLSEAMRNYRVYATEDRDLEIGYTLNGSIMGSTISLSETLEGCVTVRDATDQGAVRVEVVTESGQAREAGTIGESCGRLSFDVPAGSRYAYLIITQADGDIAVTAPVWVDNFEEMGIASFVSDRYEPVVEEDVLLTVKLYNNEPADFLLEKLELISDGTVVYTDPAPGIVYGGNTLPLYIPFSRDTSGPAELTVKITGTVAGVRRAYEDSLTVHYQPKEVPLMDIGDVRKGTLGETVRIRGYVTAGTANTYNDFPGTIYLQDDTGGIAVTGYTAAKLQLEQNGRLAEEASEGLQIGRPVEAVGILREDGGNEDAKNLVLELIRYTLPAGTYYRYDPAVTPNAAVDYAANGGTLMKVQGKVVSMVPVTLEDGSRSVSRLTLRDDTGNLVTVLIEDFIRSGTYGTNGLSKKITTGRTVQAKGLVHVDDYGKTVLRVRNCDEVVYIAPRLDLTNPRTGDWLAEWLSALGL